MRVCTSAGAPDGITSSDSGELDPFSPLEGRFRRRPEMDAAFFSGRELLEGDNFARTLDAFARTFFGLASALIRLAFAGFFTAGRPRPRFFECFAKVCACEELL